MRVLDSPEKVRLVQLFREFLEEWERDPEASIDAFAERHPEDREALRKMHRGLKWFEDFSRKKREQG